MKRMRMMGPCLVAVFAIAALGASAASAKTVIIASAGGVELAKGASISAFSSDLIFETVAGNLECEENEILGEITENKSTKLKGLGTGEISKGNYLEIPGACKTSATGPVFINSSGFNWPIEFTNKGLGKVKGSKKVAFTSTFLALEPPNNKCTFEAATVKDSTPVGTSGSPVPILLTTEKQKFKLNKKAAGTAAICPKEGLLSGHFNMTHEGKAVETEVTKI